MQQLIIILIVICSISLLYSKFNWKIWGVGLYIVTFVLIPSDVKLLSFSASTLFSYPLTLYSFWYILKHKERITDFDSNVFKILLVYLVILILLVPFASEMPIAKQLLAHKGTIMIMQFPFFMCICLQEEKDINYLWKIVWITSIIVGVYGIYCYVTQTNIYITAIGLLYPDGEISNYERFMTESRGGLIGRISSTVIHPVFYAGLLISLFFIVLQSYIEMKNNRKLFSSIFSFLILILLFVNLFLTGTRSGLVALILGLLYTFYRLTSFKTKLKYIICGFVFISLVGGSLLFSEYQTLVESTLFFWDDSKADGDIKGSSTSMRVDQLKGTFKLINDESFFLGKGHGWVNNYIDKNGPHPVLLGFESLLFSGLVQYGIIGFISLYGMFFFMLYRLNKRFNKKNNTSYTITNGLFISYIIYAFMTGAFFWGFFIGSFIFICKSFFLIDKSSKNELT